MADYTIERDGQIDFYRTFLPRIDPSLSLDDILADDNDGVLNGNLLEFKVRINDLNAVLFQTIKYLSALRIKGKPVPANILLIDLNAETAYLYKSANYLSDIEQVYNGAASKDVKGFVGGDAEKRLNYADPVNAADLINILKTKEYTKIHIDANCIVGWAKAYYALVPNGRKEDFIGDNTGKHKTIGEIRQPNVFKEYIYPYEGKDNVKFQYLMDKLNDTLLKKNLGAFYTPVEYANKSHDLLHKAIERVPNGNDYIILDRCAGTGNLEKGLSDEELSHCVLSTVEYYEYKVLQEILGSKVRQIIPPIEASDTFQAGLVKGANALSKDYIENPLIRRYVDDPHCTIILYENPPYAETTSLEHQRTKASSKSSTWKNNYVVTEMKKNVKGTVSNDLGNAFIWSGFHYFLRQPTDSYLVYSPVKYWKAQHLINKKFLGGYAYNRRWFHTNIDACIMVALWSNEDAMLESIELEGYDIDKVTGKLTEPVTLSVNRVHDLFSQKYYDKRSFDTESDDGILIGLDGIEADASVKKRIKPLYSDDMLGYLVADSVGFDNPDAKSSLLVAGRYNGNGFYLHKDNYLEKLPMFCASRYITYNRVWTERARIMKSADGAERFTADVKSGKLDQWLRKCLLFTCLEMQNHMRSFKGSDGRFYRNELCLDTTNGDTIASNDLKFLKKDPDEEKLISQWETLLRYSRETKEYNSALTYGVYQIYAEIDTSYKDDEGKTVWNNLEVHSALSTLKELVKAYYHREIVPTLFEYEFLK